MSGYKTIDKSIDPIKNVVTLKAIQLMLTRLGN